MKFENFDLVENLDLVENFAVTNFSTKSVDHCNSKPVLAYLDTNNGEDKI